MAFKKIVFIFSEGGEGREKERERNVNVPEKHQSVASSIPPTGVLAHNRGVCPDWINQWPFGSQASAQSIEDTSQDKSNSIFEYCKRSYCGKEYTENWNSLQDQLLRCHLNYSCVFWEKFGSSYLKIRL